MPKLPQPNPDLTQEDSLHMILASIAMEEVALSHIINAEGEKIQHVLAHQAKSCGCVDIDAILAVNKSVAHLLDVVMQNQLILKSKMEKVLEHLPMPSPPPPGPPKPPCPGPPPHPGPGPCPPGPPPPGPGGAGCWVLPCVPARPLADYRVVPGLRRCGEALLWEVLSDRCNSPRYQTHIPLPKSRCLLLDLAVEGALCGAPDRSVALELKICCGGKPLLSKLFCDTAQEGCFSLSGSTIIQLPEGCGSCQATLSSASAQPLEINSGNIQLRCC